MTSAKTKVNKPHYLFTVNISNTSLHSKSQRPNNIYYKTYLKKEGRLNTKSKRLLDLNCQNATDQTIITL